MEIEWNEAVKLPVVRCPVCKKNGLENDDTPYQLFMHLNSRAHKRRDLADLIQEESHTKTMVLSSIEDIN
jgi:hypothetical protein